MFARALVVSINLIIGSFSLPNKASIVSGSVFLFKNCLLGSLAPVVLINPEALKSDPALAFLISDKYSSIDLLAFSLSLGSSLSRISSISS